MQAEYEPSKAEQKTCYKCHGLFLIEEFPTEYFTKRGAICQTCIQTISDLIALRMEQIDGIFQKFKELEEISSLNRFTEMKYVKIKRYFDNKLTKYWVTHAILLGNDVIHRMDKIEILMYDIEMNHRLEALLINQKEKLKLDLI